MAAAEAGTLIKISASVTLRRREIDIPLCLTLATSATLPLLHRVSGRHIRQIVSLTMIMALAAQFCDPSDTDIDK
jgi:hypothetical protein